ncbi:MAG TPA: LCP family protein [Candidatus Limnocylindrales bacterium]|nr:LCP family protein [Candidatus Limnocylindrales bacterium]
MKNKSAGTAALLSFILPGLGHAYLGVRRQAAVFLLPTFLLAGVLALELARGADSMIAAIIAPSGSITALVLVLLAGGWRAIAMLDSFQLARHRNGVGPGGVLVAAVLLSLIIGMHGGVAYVAYAVYDAGSRIFVSAGPDDGPDSSVTGPLDGAAGPTGSGSVPGGASSPAPDGGGVTPAASPPTDLRRLNILLTGVDSAGSETLSTTDTLLVISIDTLDGSVSMVSIPRDIAGFPLHDGGTFDGKINALAPWAREHPERYPDGPLAALMTEVGYLVGVPIHYYAAVDLQGFRRMVDAVGGVTIDDAVAVHDPQYDWHDGTTGFQLPAGRAELDGRTALAYATARGGAGGGDLTRAARQQQLLIALRDKLGGPEMLTMLPSLVEVAGDTLRTNLPADRLEAFIALARTGGPGAIDRHVLGPPYTSHPPTSATAGIYTLRLDMDRLAELSLQLFGEDSRYAK